MSFCLVLNSHNIKYGLHVGLLFILVLTQGLGQISPADLGADAEYKCDATPGTNDTIRVEVIDVSINIVPYVSYFGSIYVAANTKLNISAVISKSYNESLLVFTWSTKSGKIETPPHAKDITYKFTIPNEDNFIQVTVLDPTTNATGSARFDVAVRSPVEVLDPAGKLFLERGELLDISLRFIGSAPFKYCYKFCAPNDILPCNFCFPSSETTKTAIPIIHYLHKVGNYTLMFQISNILNHDERHYAIKINDTVRKNNLPIAPIVSTILAVIILTSGVALHLKFRDNAYTTETANFDFLIDYEDEDWEREFSLIQRVKYLLCGITDQDNQEEVRYLLRKDSPASSRPGTSTGASYNAILEYNKATQEETY